MLFLLHLDEVVKLIFGKKRDVVTGKEKNSNSISEVIFTSLDTPGNMVYLTSDGEGIRKKTKDGMLHISSADGNFMGIYEAEMPYGLWSIRTTEEFVKSIPDYFKGYIVVRRQETIDLISKYIKENPHKDLEVSFIKHKNYRGMSKSPEVEYKEQKVLPDALYAGNDSLEKLTIGTGVRKIGSYSFSDCKKLESVIISKGVEIIGDSAFRGCEKLAEIYLPETLKKIGKNAFQDCIGLKKITIPQGIKEIDIGVFKNCVNLEEIEIPEGVKVIGISAFENCRELKITRIPSTVVAINRAAFKGCKSIESIRLPKGFETLGDSSFEGCSGLEDVTINSSLQDIGHSGFKDCSKLNSVIFEDEKNSKLRTIGASAFDGCRSLEEIFIPNNEEEQTIYAFAFRNSGLRKISMPSVTVIASEAFAECKNLEEIRFGEKIKGIGNHVFLNCKELQGVITIGKSVEYMEEGVFEGCSSITGVKILSENITWTQGTFEGCSSLVSVELPPKLKAIGERTFEGCTSLQEVQVPASVTEISYNAFKQCENLSMVDISIDGKLKEIKDEAFKGCVSLESVHLPRLISSLGNNAFEGCEKLKEVYASKLIKGLDEAFSGCEYVEFKTPQKTHIIVDGERIKSQEELEQEKSGKALEEAIDVAYKERKEADEIANGVSNNGITEQNVNGLTIVSPTSYSFGDRLTIAVKGHAALEERKESKAKQKLKKEMSDNRFSLREVIRAVANRTKGKDRED